ncbi:MBL fold metallo-hydrolase [Micrococcoides hystricis]|uniref:MBL fold metallo-hydrolase n=1 Tax=Micrococcoides hystricis TaxID=1572761 RepID=A0ABV6PEU9_9MICC
MPRTLMTEIIRCQNPSMMTLEGTNSYLIAAPSSDTVAIVDPGPAGHPEHIDALLKAANGRKIEVILLTHHHADHSEAAPALAQATGAPVRAFREDFCIGAGPLEDEERLLISDAVVNVLHTPGHTSDSVCFLLAGDAENGSILTGDTILGRGTTMLDYPDGSLLDYFATLDQLKSLSPHEPMLVLPAHGEPLPDLTAAAEAYMDHRHERLDQFKVYLEQNNIDLADTAVQNSATADSVAIGLYGVDAQSEMGLKITGQMVSAMADYILQRS